MDTRLSFSICQTIDPGDLRVVTELRVIGEYELIPVGLICLWSGAVADIPSGWALCDGGNGTPDLRDKFIIGAGSTYDPDETGGESSHDHTAGSAEDTHTHAATAAEDTHNHEASSANDSHTHTANFGSHGHDMPSGIVIEDVGPNGDFSHSTSTSAVSGTTDEDTHNHVVTVDNDTHTHALTVPNDTHDHAITVNAKATLPPYYALAYIMKL